MTLLAALMLGCGITLPLLVLVINPLLIWVAALCTPPRRRPVSESPPGVSMIIAVHNGEKLITAKLDNTLALDYPQEKLQIIVVSDGSEDATEEIVASYANRGILLFRLERHLGKTWALNEGVGRAAGELLVFSDTDALLPADALRQLVAHFGAPEVGGVCGQRVIGENGGDLRAAQAGYISLDSRLKLWESRLGNLTSNDGKLYAIRRSLFVPLPPAVTDDLFLCLAVARQGQAFLFEPRARALISTPSRSWSHELERRRRIVATSLHGIWLHRVLLDPFRHGFFAWRLLVNKVFRRLLPLSLPLLLAGSLLLAAEHPWALFLLVAQLLGYGLACCHLLWPRLLGRFSASAFYFALGGYGTLLGLLDFLGGRQSDKWTPRKVDGA
jgi:cellulose synthase/poly-beta-1,6-N-acetylglucosamine synthase-like glycosyltransferase